MRSSNGALRDAHWSHRSDPVHYKSEWQSVSASEEGVKRHLGVQIVDGRNLGQHRAQDEAGRPIRCCSIVPSVSAFSVHPSDPASQRLECGELGIYWSGVWTAS